MGQIYWVNTKNLLRLEADINSLNNKHVYKNMSDIEALKISI